jgi:acyl carrier protein
MERLGDVLSTTHAATLGDNPAGDTIALEFGPSLNTLATRMEALSGAEILLQIQRMMKDLFELEPDRVQPAARLVEDLELDSLDAIDLAVKVEESTGLAFDEKKLRSLRTVEDVIVALQELLASKAATPDPAPAADPVLVPARTGS